MREIRKYKVHKEVFDPRDSDTFDLEFNEEHEFISAAHQSAEDKGVSQCITLWHRFETKPDVEIPRTYRYRVNLVMTGHEVSLSHRAKLIDSISLYDGRIVVHVFVTYLYSGTY